MSPIALSRRRFLQLIAAGAAVSSLPDWAREAAAATSAGATSATSLDVLVICLAGGNDHLNTVVPASSADYRRLRGPVALGDSELIDIGGGTSINRRLPTFLSKWQAGSLSVVRGVGHPSPSLSHFVTMDRVMAGHVSGENPGSGWLGRYGDGFGPSAANGIVALGTSTPLVVRGRSSVPLTIPTQMGSVFGAPTTVVSDSDTRLIGALRDLGSSSPLNQKAALVQANDSSALALAGTLGAAVGSPDGDGLTPATVAAARLFNAAVGVRVVHITHGGYDTHAGQAPTHSRLLSELDAALARFYSELSPAAQARSCVLIYSEFGRRPYANSSAGTDHGTATDYYLLSPWVRGGLVGSEPELGNLDATGNLVATLDYRSVIAGVVGQALAGDASEVLGGTVDQLPLFRSFTDPPGYWLGLSTGTVAAFGNKPPLGNPPSGTKLASLASHPSGVGYWAVAPDGAVYGFGASTYFGGMNRVHLAQPIVDVAALPSGRGYWLLAADGGVFAFGDAQFHGSTGGMRLNRPVVAIAPTPTGAGYWFVGDDGGVFAYGDAGFFGSVASIRLVRPIVGIAATPSGRGYWLVADDGGVFAFGDARFFGSTGAIHLNAPIIGMAATPTGQGYWLMARDGGVFCFGDAQFSGSLAQRGGGTVVAFAA